MATKNTTDLGELKAMQGGTISKGFVALQKLSNTQLLAIGNTLAAGDYNPKGGHAAFAQLVGHAAPTTHAEARFIALRYFVDVRHRPLGDFTGDGTMSTGSIWHSTPNKVARRFAKTTSLARYDANNPLSFSGYKFVCVTHKLTQQRSDCLKTCAQGLVSIETGNTLYTVATKRKFDIGNAPAGAKKAVAKVKRNRAKHSKVTTTPRANVKSNDVPNTTTNVELPITPP